MAAYRRVYDSRHLQADYQEPGTDSGTLRSVIQFFTSPDPTRQNMLSVDVNQLTSDSTASC